jgi:CheY-like chemotaxis protein
MKRYDDQQSMKANLRGATLLVVDDNADHWQLIQRAMQQQIPELKLNWAATPQQALRLLESWLLEEWELPKLMLLDLHLPQASDGWQFLEAIKAMPVPVNRIPIVMLSSSIQRDDILRGYDLGIASYMVKPQDFPG